MLPMSMPLTVLALRIHPVKDAPGVELDRADVDPEGLRGDRRKKAPVHLVGADGADARANIVLDVPSTDLVALVGETLVFGDLVLGITRTAGNCAGVYADVLHPGGLAIGDRGQQG